MYQDDTGKFFSKFMDRMRSPLAFLLALAMFLSPLTPFSPVHASSPISPTADAAILGITIGGTYKYVTDDVEMFQSGVWTGDVFTVSVNWSQFASGSQMKDIKLSVYIPADQQLEITDWTRTGGFNLQYEGNEYKTAITHETINGVAYEILTFDFVDLAYAGGAAGNLSVNLKFLNGTTPNGHEADIFANFSCSYKSATSDAWYSYVATSNTLNATARAGEDWTVEKSLVTTGANAPRFVPGTKTDADPGGYMTGWEYITYLIELKGDPHAPDRMDQFGRLNMESFTITDVIGIKDLNSNHTAGAPQFVSLTKAGSTGGNVSYTGADVNSTFTSVTITSYDTKLEDGQPRPTNSSYYLTLRYPTANYTINYDANYATATPKSTVDNKATLSYKLATETSKGNSDDAEYMLGYMQGHPGFGKVNITKVAYVAGTDIFNDNASQAELTLYGPPSFRLESKTPGVDSIGPLHITAGSKAVNFTGLEPGATYVLYEDALNGFTFDGFSYTGTAGTNSNYYKMGTVNGRSYVEITMPLNAVTMPTLNFKATNTSNYLTSLNIKKTGATAQAPTTWKNLQGVTFGVYAKGDVTTLLYSGITNINGELTIVLPAGEYTVRELFAPPEYKKQGPWDINVALGKINYLAGSQNGTIRNPSAYGSVYFDKVFIGSDNKVMATWPTGDVKFAIYAGAGATGTPLTTISLSNTTRYAYWDLPVGNYSIAEIASPSGYSSQIQYENFSITENAIVPLNGGFPYENFGNNGYMLLTKTGNDNLSALNKNGTVFHVYYYNVAKSIYEFVYTETISTTNQNSSYFDPSSIMPSTRYAVVKEVPAGTYLVYEVTPPVGYILDDVSPRRLDVIANTTPLIEQTTRGWFPVRNALVFYNDRLGNVDAIKYSTYGNKAFSAGVRLRLYNLDTNSWVGDYQTPNSSGKVSFTNLQPGNYAVLETRYPTGYKPAVKYADYTLSSNNNDIQISTLDITKIPASQKITITANSATATLGVYNDPQYRLRLQKKDDTGSTVDSTDTATFNVYKQNANMSLTLVDTVTTTGDTVANSIYLDPGIYVIEEKSTTGNLILSTEKVTIEIYNDGTAKYSRSGGHDYSSYATNGTLNVYNSHRVNTLTFRNTEKRSASVHKYGATGIITDATSVAYRAIAGAEFLVYEGYPSDTNLPLNVTVGTGSNNTVYTIKTGTATKITMAGTSFTLNGLDPYQKYYVVETKAPNGYELPDNVITELNFGVAASKPVSISKDVYNFNNPGRIRVIKNAYLGDDPTNVGDGYYFNGKYDIFEWDGHNKGAYITTIYTGTDSVKNAGLTGLLPAGQYWVEEIEAPIGLRDFPTFSGDSTPHLLAGSAADQASRGQVVTVTPNDVINVEFRNPHASGSSGWEFFFRIKIDKYARWVVNNNNQDAPLAGVNFAVYAVDYFDENVRLINEALTILTSGTDGTLSGATSLLLSDDNTTTKIGDVVYAKFELVELNPPIDFTPPSGRIFVEFVFKVDGNNVTLLSQDSTSENYPGYIIFTNDKYTDEKGNPIINFGSKGSFEITKTDGSAKLQGINFHVYTGTAYPDDVTPVRDPATGSNLVLTTNSNGVITSGTLAIGKYFLVETMTASQLSTYKMTYGDNNPLEINLVTNGQKVTMTVVNLKYGQIRLAKYTAFTSNEFRVTENANVTVNVYSYKDNGDYTNETPVDIMKWNPSTASSGIATSKILPDGAYWLIETEYTVLTTYPQTGSTANNKSFMMGDTPWTAKVELKNSKIDKVNDATPSSATSYTSGNDIVVKVRNPRLGRVIVVKEFVNFDGQTIAFNTAKNATVTFAIYSDAACLNLVTEFTLANNVETSINDLLTQAVWLLPGSYYLVEKSARLKDHDFVVNSDPIYFEVRNMTNTNNSTIVYRAYSDDLGFTSGYDFITSWSNSAIANNRRFINYSREGQYRIEKRDVSNALITADHANAAVVNVYASNANGDVLGDILKTHTLVNGFELDKLDPGKYVAIEAKPPKGFVLSNVEENKVYFDVVAGKAASVTFNSLATFVNPKQVSVEILKYNPELGDATTAAARLQGAIFALYKLDGTQYVPYLRNGVIYERTTTNLGVIDFVDLEEGTYRLVETKAPQGYIINPDYADAQTSKLEFEVTNSSSAGAIVNLIATPNKLEATNTSYNIHLYVRKFETTHQGLINTDGSQTNYQVWEDASYDAYDLDGAVFAVYSEESLSDASFQGSAITLDGRLSINYLDPSPTGTYWLVELIAPPGYQKLLSDKIEITLGSDNKYAYYCFNEKIPGSLDANIGIAKWIYKDDGNHLIDDTLASLYSGQQNASYLLTDLFAGGNNVELTNFVVTDRNVIYNLLQNTNTYVNTPKIEGYTFTKITVMGSDDKSSNDIYARVYYDNGIDYLPVGPAQSVDKRIATFDISAVLQANEQAVGFAVYYGYQVNGEFVARVGVDFNPGDIKADITFNKRTSGAAIPEVRRIDNKAAVNFNYTYWTNLGIQENINAHKDSNDVHHFLPPTYEQLPPISIEKLNTEANKTFSPDNPNDAFKTVYYTITIKNEAGGSDLNVYKPTVVDVMDYNQYPSYEYPNGYILSGDAAAIARATNGDESSVRLERKTQTNSQNGKADQVLIWYFPGYLAPGDEVVITYSTRINETLSKAIAHTANSVYLTSLHKLEPTPDNPHGLSFDGVNKGPIDAIDNLIGTVNGVSTPYYYVEDSARAIVTRTEGIFSVKQVYGTIDYELHRADANNFLGVSQVAETYPAELGGEIFYKLSLTNYETRSHDAIRIIDILPHLGDTMVYSGQGSLRERLTAWQRTPKFKSITILDGQGNDITNQVQKYHQVIPTDTTNKPLSAINNTMVRNDWSNFIQNLPANNEFLVLGLDFGNYSLPSGETLVIYITLDSPSLSALEYGEHAELTAWNSFAYSSLKAGSITAPLPAEPPEVGVRMMPPLVALGNYTWEDRNWDDLQGEYDNGVLDRTFDPAAGNLLIKLYYRTDGHSELGQYIGSYETNAEGEYYFKDLYPTFIVDGVVYGTYHEYRLEVFKDGRQITINGEDYAGELFEFVGNRTGTDITIDSNTYEDLAGGGMTTEWFVISWEDIALHENTRPGPGNAYPPKAGMIVYDVDDPNHNYQNWIIGDPTWDFGIRRKPVEFELFKFEDAAKDGVYTDANDIPLKDIYFTITITPKANTGMLPVTETVYTDDQGKITFDATHPLWNTISKLLIPGTTIEFVEQLQNGRSITGIVYGKNNNTIYPVVDNKFTIVLDSNIMYSGRYILDVGNSAEQRGSFEMTKFNTATRPSTPTAETYMAGVVFHLYTAAGVWVDTYTSTTEGHVEFNNLAYTSYLVYEELLPGYKVTFGSINNGHVNATDVVEEVLVARFTVSDGSKISLTSNDVGNMPIEYLLFKFEDVNENGYYDIGDKVLEKIPFTFDEFGGIVLGSTETDTAGQIVYRNYLQPGTQIVIQEQDLPGVVYTINSVTYGSDHEDNQVNNPLTDNEFVITVNSSLYNPGTGKYEVNVGNIQNKYDLDLFKFWLNKRNQQKVGLAGIEFQIWSSADLNTSIIRSTDADGLLNISKNEITLRVGDTVYIQETIKPGYAINELNYGNNGTVQNINGTFEFVLTKAMLAANANQSVSFSFDLANETPDLDLIKFHDLNSDGIMDGSDPLLKGIELRLSWVEQPNGPAVSQIVYSGDVGTAVYNLMPGTVVTVEELTPGTTVTGVTYITYEGQNIVGQVYDIPVTINSFTFTVGDHLYNPATGRFEVYIGNEISELRIFKFLEMISPDPSSRVADGVYDDVFYNTPLENAKFELEWTYTYGNGLTTGGEFKAPNVLTTGADGFVQEKVYIIPGSRVTITELNQDGSRGLAISGYYFGNQLNKTTADVHYNSNGVDVIFDLDDDLDKVNGNVYQVNIGNTDFFVSFHKYFDGDRADRIPNIGFEVYVMDVGTQDFVSRGEFFTSGTGDIHIIGLRNNDTVRVVETTPGANITRVTYGGVNEFDMTFDANDNSFEFVVHEVYDGVTFDVYIENPPVEFDLYKYNTRLVGTSNEPMANISFAVYINDVYNSDITTGADGRVTSNLDLKSTDKVTLYELDRQGKRIVEAYVQQLSSATGAITTTYSYDKVEFYIYETYNDSLGYVVSVGNEIPELRITKTLRYTDGTLEQLAGIGFTLTDGIDHVLPVTDVNGVTSYIPLTTGQTFELVEDGNNGYRISGVKYGDGHTSNQFNNSYVGSFVFDDTLLKYDVTDGVYYYDIEVENYLMPLIITKYNNGVMLAIDREFEFELTNHVNNATYVAYTDNYGQAIFYDIKPGTNVTIREIGAVGGSYDISQVFYGQAASSNNNPFAPGIDTSNFSTLPVTGGNSFNFTVNPSFENNLGIPYLAIVVNNAPYGSITINKFRDYNNNGIWDAGEPIMPDTTPVSFQLRDSADNLLGTYNIVNGTVTISGLAMGTYFLVENLPAGYFMTPVGVANRIPVTISYPDRNSGHLRYYSVDVGNGTGGYNPPNEGGSTTITIPGGTPAGTVLDFVVNNNPIQITVPVNIPADTPFVTTFDPNGVPLANLPNLIEKEIEELFPFDDPEIPTIPSTGDASLDALLFWSFLFLACVTVFNVSRKRLWNKQ